MKNFYITTTLPYVNAKPHMGHALEFIHADIIARYHRLRGENVFFNTGTDEHGQKIYEKAKEEGRDPKEYVDEYAAKFAGLKAVLNLSYDKFIRTTDAEHKLAAQEIWKRCEKNGDIYKKKYKGLYCVGDEMFLRDADLVEGRCPNHPNMIPVEIEEENYFFKLSAYQERLIKYLEGEVIIPEWRKTEAINFVKGGLQDFSISREKSRLAWGVPVPEDDNQVMYVWFDALTNYISTLDWPDDKDSNFKNFWANGEVIQIAGKDQVRFQSIMWQAMLMSADVKNTDKVLYHGFITSAGAKMSKSLGNVIDPMEIVEKYGTDALRYWCAKEANTFEDSDFTWDKFKESYNADLANGLGNLASRIIKMAVSYGVKMRDGEDREFVSSSYLNVFEIQKEAEEIWAKIRQFDSFIQKTEPFKKIKTNREEAKRDIEHLLLGLYDIAYQLQPFLPQTAEKILGALKDGEVKEIGPLFPRIA